jgi:hypothetical protein
MSNYEFAYSSVRLRFIGKRLDGSFSVFILIVMFLQKDRFLTMNSYNSEFYRGVDVHPNRSCLCILYNTEKKYLNRNIVNNFDNFKRILDPFLSNIVVGCESMDSYCWLVDGCHEHRIPFDLGHALYMKSRYIGIEQTKKPTSSEVDLNA